MTDESNDVCPAPENLTTDAATPEEVAADLSAPDSPTLDGAVTSEDAAKPPDAVTSEISAEPDAVGTSSVEAECSATESHDTESHDTEPAQAPTKPELALRMRIGSLREGDSAKQAKPNPTTAGVPPSSKTTAAPMSTPLPDPKKYPPPNIRQQLPPELEKEVEDALGGRSLDEMIEGSAPSAAGVELEPESRVEGCVVTIRHEDVFLDLGGRNQGVVPLKQFDQPPELGTKVEVQIQRLNREDGLYEATLPGAVVDVGDWGEVSEGLMVEAVVTGHNKGGLDCQVGNLRGFMPVSQISLYRVEDLEPFVGEKFSCVVTEADPERRNLVLSRRAVLERERSEVKQKLIKELAVGQEREGVVTNLLDFGAFVDLGGIDGLVHISQLSWDRVGHPSEVFQVGQKVKVKVKKIDTESGKIALGYRELLESPWSDVAEKYPVASHVRGTVTKILDFGALVKVEPGVAGLVHISELSHQRVQRVSDVVHEGQEVEVQVLTVDADAQRMSLSIKALETSPAAKRAQAKREEQPEEVVPSKPRVKPEHLKGGLDRGTGGEQFGLKW